MSLVGAACLFSAQRVASAQAPADAGSERSSAVAHASESAPAPAVPPQASPFFPKPIPPSMLADSVLADSVLADSVLADSVQARLAQHDARKRLEGEVLTLPDEARMRRVVSLETEQGITILSNRLSQPAPKLAKAAPTPSVDRSREGETVVERPEVTETLGLQASASASVPRDAGQSWLGWLLASFMAVSAVIGTLWFGKLWFRKKTQA